MVGWHHRLNGHEFEQALGNGERQGSLVCCSSWGCKELDTTERLNNNKPWESFACILPNRSLSLKLTSSFQFLLEGPRELLNLGFMLSLAHYLAWINNKLFSS